MNPSLRPSAHRNFRADPQDRIVPTLVKAPRRLVAVIAGAADLNTAVRLRNPPDFFELRLDSLHRHLPEIERAIPRLRAPLILTARHPDEGGRQLPTSARRELLQRFLPDATFVDLEIYSVPSLDSLLKEIRREKIGLLLSWHELRDTPPQRVLREALNAARGAGADVFKIATRTDNPAQLARLLAFFTENRRDFPIAAMGLGRLGGESRRRLFRMGSVLNFCTLGKANAPGQLSLRQLRRISGAYTI
jgi:3-dehydroquinate dehydratase-1